MQKQIICNLVYETIEHTNAGGVCYDTHFRTYIITHDRGQREAASISVFHLFINGIVRAHDRRKSAEQDQKCRESRTAVGWTSWNYAAMWFLGSSVQPLCRTSHYGWNAASTSDEMLPIFISEAVAPATIIKILGAKVCIAIVSGFLAELVYVNILKKKEKDMDIHVVCEEEHCSCEDGVLKSALKHTFKIFVYILLITFMLTFVIELIGEDQLAVVFQDIPVVGEMIAALVGLIPNCASSVVITELYLSGIIGAGAMMSGLLVNAGVGLLVLFRLNRNWKQNAGIMAALYGFGVVWGVIIELLGIVF